MKLYAKCNACKRRRFFIRKREFIARGVAQPIRSQNELCRSCYNTIKKMI